MAVHLALRTSTIGLLGLLLIAGFLVYLFIWRRGVDRKRSQFYLDQGLTFESSPPIVVQQALGSARWTCRKGVVQAVSGATVPMHWWEGFATQQLTVGASSHASMHCYLAVSFSPGSVHRDFQQKAIDEMNFQPATFRQKLRRFFIFDTKTPIRAEALPDGTFLILWRTLMRADVYEDRLHWLRRTVLPSHSTPTAPPSMNQRLSHRDLVSSAPESSRAEVITLMCLLDSYHRDFHDTKAHPMMSLQDHAQDLKLSTAEIEGASKALKRSGYSADQLVAMGYLDAGSGSARSDAMDVAFPHRRMIYLIAQDVYLDPERPGCVYGCQA